jgi:hypothetical protein
MVIEAATTQIKGGERSGNADETVVAERCLHVVQAHTTPHDADRKALRQRP